MIGSNEIAIIVRAETFELVGPGGDVVAVLAPLPAGTTRTGDVLAFTVPAGLGLDPDLRGSMGSALFSTVPGDPPYAAAVQLVGFTVPGLGAPEVLMLSAGDYIESTLAAGRATVVTRDVAGAGDTVQVMVDASGAGTPAVTITDLAGITGAVEVWGPWTTLPLAANWSAWDAARTPQFRRSWQIGAPSIGRAEFAGLVRRDTVAATAAGAYPIAALGAANPAATRYHAALTSAGFGALIALDGDLNLNVSAAHPGVPIGGWVALDSIGWNLDGAP